VVRDTAAVEQFLSLEAEVTEEGNAIAIAAAQIRQEIAQANWPT
jgi:uncharacterized protein YoaH (UPF0181 family)